jgi:hypothetical protein
MDGLGAVVMAVPWGLVAKAGAIISLVLLLAWVGHRVKVSYRAEAERDHARAEFVSYRNAVEAQAKRDAAQRAKDQAGDQALTSRVASLQADNEALRRAASRVPATVEKPDAHGNTSVAVNPDWMLCRISATLGHDPADVAACKARAGDGSVPNPVSN